MKQTTQPHRSLWWFLRHCVNWSAIFFWIVWPASVLTGIIIAIVMLVGCSPKLIEQHHHHYEQADTASIKAQVDQQLQSWHAQMDSSWTQRWQEYTASMVSNEDQKEHITETITTYIDSLGREVRQEQRTTDRSLSKMQQQTEQRLTREFEMRLQQSIDSLNNDWQLKFDALQTHWEKKDSTDVKETTAEGTLPWYKRWWQSLKDYLLIAAIILILIATRRIWWPLLKK